MVFFSRAIFFVVFFHYSGNMRVTELQNDITLDLDIVSSAKMMNLFQQANHEIFKGWKQELFINHHHHLENIQKFVTQVDNMIKQVNEISYSIYQGSFETNLLTFLTFVVR